MWLESLVFLVPAQEAEKKRVLGVMGMGKQWVQLGEPRIRWAG